MSLREKIEHPIEYLDDAVSPAKKLDYDFVIEARGGDATTSFVRVVKLP